MNIAIIILAAGESKRMGSPKQLLDINGESMLQRLIHSALETSCYPVTVVVGANKNLIVPKLQNIPINIVDNPNWKSGMASSVKMGLIGTYMISAGVEAVLIMTADMPGINKNVINELIKTAKENPDKGIIASDYQGVIGVPVIFQRSMFEHLLDLNGEGGARGLIRSMPEQVISVPIGSIGQDLDTKEDYYNYINSLN